MVHSRLLRPLVVVSGLTSLSLAAFQQVSNDQCNCFLTNGSRADYFTSHKFFDYREKSEYATVPALIGDPDDSSEADPASDYFSSNEWIDNWTLQNWDNKASLSNGVSDATTLMVNSPNNVYLEKNNDPDADSSTFLTMRTARLEDFQTASEFESTVRNYHFLSARMYARTIGAPGAVTAIFTYRDMANTTDPTKVQESDLEIRTIDPPDHVQYTNQPSYTSMGLDVQEATRNVTIPKKRDWTNWAVYRMDWSPGATTWYINGDEVASISFQAPRDPSLLILNSWSDGGSWSGNMSVGKEAYLQIQWIELVYNATGPSTSKRDDQSCVNICSIDETEKIGAPVLLQGSASSLLGQMGSFAGLVSWVSVLSTVIAFW
ncbi:glycoside hydrolase family 16 protein [Daldinia decipiens]|uniref:glycoside hydrolase family 16 protein n=1 Tax=Daldinia decipiens TaxID=326647 RepID=UPI0020C4E3B3|nr:glycoside hydrolase family 16 protein [Daldinia decipiens]KAI1661685.1 glycoside hydrolase family 16 protein [Daldinia decipiens]